MTESVILEHHATCLFILAADPNVHLDKCTYFDQARLDQRFEVADEPVLSICGKFARSTCETFFCFDHGDEPSSL